jgi:hypothetical protein
MRIAEGHLRALRDELVSRPPRSRPADGGGAAG